MSQYTFYFLSSKYSFPFLQSSLNNTIQNISKSQLPVPSLKAITSANLIYPICHYNPFISKIYLDVTNKWIITRNERELKQKIQSLPIHAYLRTNNIDKNLQVSCQSYRSNLYHEGMISNIVRNQLFQGLLHQQNNIKYLPEDFQNNKGMKVFKHNEQLIEKLQIFLVKDKLKLLIQMHHEDLNQFGHKKYVGQAPFRDDLSFAVLEQTIFKIPKELLNNSIIWDPFCGSGTFLISCLIKQLQLPLRKESEFLFESIANISEGSYNEYLENMKTRKYEYPNETIFIGSDHSMKQYQQIQQNLNRMKEEFDIGNKNKIKLQINNPNIISDSFSDLNTLIIKGDYQLVYSQIKKTIQNKQIQIITNIPWNLRVEQSSNLIQEFIGFINNHKNSFSSIWIICHVKQMQSFQDICQKYEFQTQQVVQMNQGGQECVLISIVINKEQALEIIQQKQEAIKIKEEKSTDLDLIPNQPKLTLQELKKKYFLQAATYARNNVLKRNPNIKNTNRSQFRQLVHKERLEYVKRRIRNLEIMQGNIKRAALQKREEKKAIAGRVRNVDKFLKGCDLDNEKKLIVQQKLDKMAEKKLKDEVRAMQKKENIRKIAKW